MERKNMPVESLTFLQRLQEYGLLGYGWILILSAWAGTVRYITALNGSKPTFFGWISEVVVSGFVGILAAMVCHYAELDYLVTAAITGIAAHEGTRGLYLVSSMLKKNSSYFGDSPLQDYKLNSKQVKNKQERSS